MNDMFFMNRAEEISNKSSCLRRKVGAVLVKNGEIIAEGYNHVPNGSKTCEEIGGCKRTKLGLSSGERIDICRSVHAEQWALAELCKKRISSEGCILYSTTQPCEYCTKLIIMFGIKRVVYKSPYQQDESILKMFQDANIEVIQLNNK